MPKLRVAAFSVSLDGFGAGVDQSLENPLGVGGMRLHEWFFGTTTFQAMTGAAGGEAHVDDAYAKRSFDNLGAWILGRHMFGPVRGPWLDDSWRGWWGDNPPYHVPVFVLTHHARPPLEMKGGTVFHFITAGIHEALARAREAAGPRDVRVGGGVATVRQYLEAGLIDEMHLAITPTLLGRGEALFAGIDLVAQGFRCIEQVGTPKALHVVLAKD
ncbi:dihydrofolate reductase [Hylemonella gracilis]|uniref:Dihydrofolate reductase n=1 Tax=Hylemonella gracilis TaxID=80880 RepID=A0A4P6ULJ5_9BURK|nr:dihydrofolate reductase family protein [Hylemonella gracilis]QBK06033.1 dihydrofolate reductase [Hylemonella gracilis]